MIRYLNDLEAREPEVIQAVSGAFFRPDPQAVEAELLKALKDPGMRVVAACVNNQVVGVAVFALGHQAEIQRIGVHPRFRNRGLGRQMINWAGAQWKKPIIARTDEDAAGFYRRVGFEVVETAGVGGRKRFDCTRA